MTTFWNKHLVLFLFYTNPSLAPIVVISSSSTAQMKLDMNLYYYYTMLMSKLLP